MLRLFGMLTIGNLLFGGHRHHRALRRGLLLGALLSYLSNRSRDMKRAQEEAREAAEDAGRAARRAARAVREEIRDVRRAARRTERAVREEIRDVRRAEHARRTEERMNAIRAEIKSRFAEQDARKTMEAEYTDEVRALPVNGINEAREIQELVGDLERNTGDAAAAVNVPTIDFPDEDGKYFSAGKYGTA